VISLDEFKQRRRPVRDIASDLRMIQQQAVRQDAVTGDANWDYFLAYLEHALQNAEGAREAEDRKLRNPQLVNDEQIRACKVSLAQIEARIGTLKEILMLPKFLKEHGDLAKKQIEELTQAKK
jgi:hypothetical protein